MIPPGGYRKLPDGVRCRCPGLWRDPDSEAHWCCVPEGSAMETNKAALKLCINCANCEQNGAGHSLPGIYCLAVNGSIDPVSGVMMERAPASTIRLSKLCGWQEAKLFTPKT